jgi:hypothetical protein
MKKASFSVLALAIVLALACSMLVAVPTTAQTPPEANTNSIGIGISVPSGTYYYGDTIMYTVIVYVPAASPPIHPAQQTDIEAHLVLPDGTDINLGTVVALNPGVSHAFPAVPYVVDPLDAVLDVVTASAYCDGTAQLFPTVASHANVEVSSNIASPEVGGTVLPVNKLGLLAPWVFLLSCAGIVTFLLLRKKRHA